MNPEQWLSLKWNGGSTMSDRWLNQSKIIQFCICQYRVYEEINIQNTGGTDYAEQITFKGSRYM